MRRFKWISLIPLYIFTVWCLAFWGRVLPGTTVGSGVSLARLNREEVHIRLESLLHSPNVSVHLPDRVEITNLADLGLSIDEELLTTSLFADSTPAEIARLAKGLLGLASRKNITLVFNIAEDSVLFPVTDRAKSRIVYNSLSGEFGFEPPLYDYSLSALDIIPKAAAAFGSPAPAIDVTSRRVEHHDPFVNSLNSRLAHTSSHEIFVRVKDGKDYSDIALSPSEIRQMLAFTTRGDSPALDVDRTVFENTIVTKLSDRQKSDFQLEEAYPNTIALLNRRFEFDNVIPVVLGIDDGPTSGGSLADRYIEVDISQQKMYFFIDGSLYREIRVSTGYDYPTPPGKFHILNKAPKAFSNIYSVWMEYWMGFEYANDIGAYLGIHELAYATDEKGKHIYQLGNYIGEPKTGGCIALRPGEAREIYDNSYVGMLVNIVE